MSPSVSGIRPYKLVEPRLRYVRLVMFQNQLVSNGWLKEFSEASSSSRFVRLRCGSDWSALAREQLEISRTLKEGIMLMTCGQSSTVLRFTLLRLRYCREERRVNHERSVEFVPPIEERSRCCSADKLPSWGGKPPRKCIPERLRYLRLFREPKNSGRRPIDPSSSLLLRSRYTRCSRESKGLIWPTKAFPPVLRSRSLWTWPVRLLHRTPLHQQQTCSPWPPFRRHELRSPCRVAGDVVLEGQQCVPLVREAAHARSVTTSWWLGLLLGMRGEEEAAGDDEQHENRSWAMHDGQWQWQQQSTVLLC